MAEMPKKECEADDPMELVGMVFSATEEADREMVSDFIDEYLWLGWSPAQIAAAFKDPFYLATHRIWKEKGEKAVIDLIETRMTAWRRGRKS